MEFNSREREVLASALKLKLKQTIALEKKVIAELGDSSPAAKSMLLERSNIEALHHKLEGQSKLLD